MRLLMCSSRVLTAWSACSSILYAEASSSIPSLSSSSVFATLAWGEGREKCACGRVRINLDAESRAALQYERAPNLNA